MRVLVYNIAASEGGALTVLKEFYDLATATTDIEWKFIISTPQLAATDNIAVENYPEIKRSWLVRLKFDKFKIGKIIKEFNPDYVLNLQNIAIKTKANQMLYMHQSLPFIDFKFSIADKKMWVYQNIIGRMIKKSLKRVSHIIVQTEWIKRAIIEQCGIRSDIIEVKLPSVNISEFGKYIAPSSKVFFFPAASYKYKNHAVIVEACKILKSKGIDYKVVFTLLGNEDSYIKSLHTVATECNLNIEWKGTLSYNNVKEMYTRSTLIFPSYIETFGLPLLEARVTNAPIIAARESFSLEVLEGYDNAKFFDRFDAARLAELMQE